MQKNPLTKYCTVYGAYVTKLPVIFDNKIFYERN
jgi:hypothetical protein